MRSSDTPVITNFARNGLIGLFKLTNPLSDIGIGRFANGLLYKSMANSMCLWAVVTSMSTGSMGNRGY